MLVFFIEIEKNIHYIEEKLKYNLVFFLQTSKHEDQLNKQLQLLRDQFNLRKSNISEQCSTLEVLREEVKKLFF